MAVRRRPAARAPALRRRPSVKEVEELKTDKFTYLLELTAAQLRCLGLVELAYGYYYDGLVKVAGYITGLGRDPDYLEFKVTGTQTERMVDMWSDPARRVMQLHICPPFAYGARHLACRRFLGGERKETTLAYSLREVGGGG